MTKTPLKTIKTGNQTLIRQCSDEILALRKSGYSRTRVCEMISELFFLDQDILTPNRLATSLSTVLAGDSESEAASREARINTLRGNIEMILQNLRTKSSLHNKKLLSIVPAPTQSPPQAQLPAQPITAKGAAVPKVETSSAPVESASDEANERWSKILAYMNSARYSFNEKNVPSILSALESSPATYRNLNPHQLYSKFEKLLND